MFVQVTAKNVGVFYETQCTCSLQFATHLPDCLFRISFRRYRPFNLPLVAKSLKKVVLGPEL